MKVNIFKNLIREVVREELAYAMGRLEKNIQETIVKYKVNKINEEAPKDDVYKKLQKKLDSNRPLSENKDTPPLTKNQIINNLLEETAKGEEWKNMDDETKPSVRDNTELPEHLSDAFNKDYSELIKAVDKKSGNNVLPPVGS
jgi:hypothetical protein